MIERRLRLPHICWKGGSFFISSKLTVDPNRATLFQGITWPHRIQSTVQLMRNDQGGLSRAIKDARKEFKDSVCARCKKECEDGCKAK